jgi:hypothetical protein
MDQSTPKGSMPPAVEGMGEKRPWASPVLKRLDVGLTSQKNSSDMKPFDGGPSGGQQHS